MIKFNGKILFLGCGSVAQCTLPILLKHLDIQPNHLTIIDFIDHRDRIRDLLHLGVNYVQKKITENNHQEILESFLSPGDILIDLSWNIDTLVLLEWCHQHDVMYLNTSVEKWNPFDDKKNTRKLTLYHRQMAIRELISHWENQNGPTLIVDHGANPGLVSHFYKEGLIDIANKIIHNNPRDPRRNKLEKAIETHDFAALAFLEEVKTIHISEKDTQVTSKPKEVGEFVNTWSIAGLIEEGLSPAELGWGTHEYVLPSGINFHEEGPKNQIYLSQKGINTWVRSWVPSGEITGMVIRHGEAFSISDHLTIWENGQAIYRPTVNYAYCPCDSTINSLHELAMRHYHPQEKQRILNDDIISGKDELGCLLMGHDFNAWWIGSVLDINEARQLAPGQNATTVQVAIGIVGAILYMVRHPRLGFCLPDDLDYQEILAVAKPYLGKFISTPVNWSPLLKIEEVLEFNEPIPPIEEQWQFTTFQTFPGKERMTNTNKELKMGKAVYQTKI